MTDEEKARRDAAAANLFDNLDPNMMVEHLLEENEKLRQRNLDLGNRVVAAETRVEEQGRTITVLKQRLEEAQRRGDWDFDPIWDGGVLEDEGGE